MLVMLPIFSTAGLAHQSTVLEIGEIDEGLLVGVASIIKNIGDAPAKDVAWSIRFEGGIVLIPLGSERNGACDSIDVGGEKNIFSGPVFGFGVLRPMEITVSAQASNADPVKRTEIGWIFLFIMQV